MPQLTWNNFQNKAKFVLTTKDSQDFTNVTLVAADNYQVHVSKVMLCSASLLFRRILIQNEDSHSMIYLEGVYNEELDNIVGFI